MIDDILIKNLLITNKNIKKFNTKTVRISKINK